MRAKIQFEKRFSSHTHLERAGKPNHPSNIIEGTGMEVAVFSFGEASCLVVVQTFTSSIAGSVNGTRYCNEILLPFFASFRGRYGSEFLFMDDNATCHRKVAAEQLLESEDIERMDWPPRSPDLNPIKHVCFLGRRAWQLVPYHQ
ncbi:transposable element Tcb2 transposase [Trichonephila clavipes]|nr:transposable element Tcb2 transposase [Trichonephila clavipes]